jgi:hypothetical protein
LAHGDLVAGGVTFLLELEVMIPAYRPEVPQRSHPHETECAVRLCQVLTPNLGSIRRGFQRDVSRDILPQLLQFGIVGDVLEQLKIPGLKRAARGLGFVVNHLHIE